ncbi:MAG TPA: LysR family transcriptional regulator [Candidatus Binatia bacterium]|nr:LysR family transcriptional regulator [Candidatus Binatia bacterium]
MTLNQIKAFEAVSKYLNITRAAESLNISEPSVFKQVKSLEDFCGVRLYRKVGRRIELTREGRLLQPDVREILTRVERLGQRFKQVIPAPNGGSLAVGGSHAPSVALIPSLLARFKENHPHTQIMFRTKSSRGIEQLVLQSQVEVGVITNPSTSPMLRLLPCREENVVVVVFSKHPLAKKFELSPGEIAQAPLIIKKGRQGRPSDLLTQIESHGFRLNVAMECESGQAIKIAVMKGMGIGILYRDQVESELETGALKTLRIAGLKRINGRSFIVYRKGRPLSQNALDYLALLREPRQRIGWNGALEKAS